MSLFRGYVKCKGKKAIESYKNVERYRTFEEVKDCDSYAGILAEDVILVDVDDAVQSEVLMNIVEDLQLDCRVYQTTRGRHFLFKNDGVRNCKTGWMLACGITADIKIGEKNGLEFLKVDGVERFIEWDSDTYQELPKWLLPMSKTDYGFFGMAEGDGRDSKLYSYILTLNAAGFSKDESRKCIELINKYILADPMSDADIERITRDDAFPADTFFNKDGKFLHNNFAQFIKANEHVKRINGQLHVYRNGAYVTGHRDIELTMIKHIPTLKAQQRTEVLKYLDIICSAEEEVADANLIAFKNKVLNFTTGEVFDHSPETVITNLIPWDYNPDAYSEIADSTLNKIACDDPDVRAVIEEAIGYSFYRRNELSKSFFLTGEGSNGKSTFLDMLSDVFGGENRSALGLEELDERFSTIMLSNKLINVGDDISDEFWNGRAVAMFKKLVSGNEVKAEYKGQDAVTIKPYTKFFFSANSLPRSRSRGFEAVKRRLVIIPFNAKFSKDDADYDPYIVWKLKDRSVMEYIIKIGLEGLKRVLANRGFTESSKVAREIEEYELENNPIIMFLKEKDMSEIENQPTTDVHRAYKIFCIENGYQEMTLSNLSKELNRRCNLQVVRRRINGKLTGIYVKGEAE